MLIKRNKIGLAVLTLLILTVLISGCSSDVSTSGSPETQGSSELTYKAGLYTATKDGKNGSITINVTFSDTAITAIDIVESNETEALGGEALNDLAKNIIDKQSLSVDTITGATISTEALLDAVEDCVKQAGGDVEAIKK